MLVASAPLLSWRLVPRTARLVLGSCAAAPPGGCKHWELINALVVIDGPPSSACTPFETCGLPSFELY